MNTLTNLTPQQLRHAADIQDRILDLQQKLARLLGAVTPSADSAPAGKQRLSAEGLANIRAGAQRRWAKFHAKAGDGAPAKKPRRKMSAAGRASIVAKLKARWAAAKRAGRNAL